MKQIIKMSNFFSYLAVASMTFCCGFGLTTVAVKTGGFGFSFAFTEAGTEILAD
jgi:hypothetical protein